MHVEFQAAIRIYVFPDQRLDRTPIDGGQPVFPVRPGTYLLQHPCVEVDHAVLEQVPVQRLSPRKGKNIIPIAASRPDWQCR